VCLADERTDGRTDDDSIFHASIASRGKNDAARITKLDKEMFHDESWKPIYFGVKRSKVTSHKNIAGVGLYHLVSVGCF